MESVRVKVEHMDGDVFRTSSFNLAERDVSAWLARQKQIFGESDVRLTVNGEYVWGVESFDVE